MTRGADTRHAETHLRLLTEAELRRDGARPAAKVQAVAHALSAIGAVHEDVAGAILISYDVALFARQRDSGPFWRMGRMARSRPAKPAPSGPFRAIGIARKIRVSRDGRAGEIWPLAIVIAPDRTVLPVVGYQAEQAEDDDDDPIFDFFSHAAATDDRGGKYRLGFSGGGGRTEWRGELDMHPTPPAGLRWIELTFWPGTESCRIDLTAPDSAQHGTLAAVPDTDRAGRYLDAIAGQLLSGRISSARSDLDSVTCLSDILAAFSAAGVMDQPPPALPRLITLARRAGLSLPADLADVPDAELPPAWLSVLDGGARRDGPTGTAPAAAVLPELDGARWVVAGVRSTPESGFFHVLGWGAQRSRRDPRDATPDAFSWWARDSADRWHTTTAVSERWNDEHTDMVLELAPPLHPDATSLDIIVTGRTGQVSVTLPLDWRTE